MTTRCFPTPRFCTGLWSRGGFQGRWYEFRCENNFQSVCQMILHDHARTNCPSASFPESSSVNVINFETSPYLLSVTIILSPGHGFCRSLRLTSQTPNEISTKGKTQFNNWLVTIQNPQSSRPQQILTVRSVSTTIPPPLPPPTSTSSSINTISNNNHNPLLDTQSSVTQLTSV